MSAVHRFVRDRIWADLPARPTRSQRLLAALLWGIVLPVGFIVVQRLRHGGPSRATMAILLGAGLVLAVLLVLPRVGDATYLAVLRVFAVVGFVVFTTALTLAFFLLLTPAGWILRATGKLRYDRSFRGGRPPAWRERPAAYPRARYARMS